MQQRTITVQHLAIGELVETHDYCGIVVGLNFPRLHHWVRVTQVKSLRSSILYINSIVKLQMKGIGP